MTASVAAIARDKHHSEHAIGTGLDHLDDLTGGFIPGSVWVLTGPSGVGRSTLALQLSIHAAEQGASTWFVSAMMPAEEVGIRMLRQHTQLRSRHFGQPDRADKGNSRLCSAVTHLSELPIYREDSSDEPFSDSIVGLLTAPIDRRVLVIDDIDFYEDQSNYGTGSDETPSRPDNILPEQLRVWAVRNGSTVMVTRPTTHTRKQFRQDIPAEWLRAADVVVHIDTVGTRDPHIDKAVFDNTLAYMSALKKRARTPRGTGSCLRG
ncbi:DnaB-like helicase C-terminal domain-containing protein [Nakamurella antarctica]|uniref:DnaB-like helicase C-terminal domain-containing protein n=1 Tax=Nakamurella antarctica TaxID=1902245 RepID=UPI0013DD9465|nr:DnaB-like helicase C-terminal domain-containing protein [Nakamurella antarctica]